MEKIWRDLPGGPVIKVSSANAGDTGSIPGPGRFHMLWSNKARVTQPMKPVHARAHTPQLLSLCVASTETCVPRACAPQQEKPPQ